MKKNLSYLIVAVLVVLAFVRGAMQFWCLLGAFAAWGAWMIVSERKRIHTFFRRHNRKTKRKKAPAAASIDVPNVSAPPYGELLMRHVNCRITEYLKSAYPTLTWEWTTDAPEDIIAQGGTGVIQVFGVPEFNHAQVQFSSRAGMDVAMMNIVPLKTLAQSDEAAQKKPAASVDISGWYDLHAKVPLEECISELNTRGHASLSIQENGDIYIYRGNERVRFSQLENLPGRPYWQAVAAMLTKQAEVEATVCDDAILLKW